MNGPLKLWTYSLDHLSFEGPIGIVSMADTRENAKKLMDAELKMRLALLYPGVEFEVELEDIEQRSTNVTYAALLDFSSNSPTKGTLPAKRMISVAE